MDEQNKTKYVIECKAVVALTDEEADILMDPDNEADLFEQLVVADGQIITIRKVEQ